MIGLGIVEYLATEIAFWVASFEFMESFNKKLKDNGMEFATDASKEKNEEDKKGITKDTLEGMAGLILLLTPGLNLIATGTMIGLCIKVDYWYEEALNHGKLRKKEDKSTCTDDGNPHFGDSPLEQALERGYTALDNAQQRAEAELAELNGTTKDQTVVQVETEPEVDSTSSQVEEQGHVKKLGSMPGTKI